MLFFMRPLISDVIETAKKCCTICHFSLVRQVLGAQARVDLYKQSHTAIEPKILRLVPKCLCCSPPGLPDIHMTRGWIASAMHLGAVSQVSNICSIMRLSEKELNMMFVLLDSDLLVKFSNHN